MTDEQYIEAQATAVNLRRAGRYVEARAIAMEIAKVRPLESSVWHTLGQLWTDIGEFSAALECNQEAYRLVSQMPRAPLEQIQTISLGLAVSLMRFGRFEEAFKFWELGRLNVSWSPWPGARYWAGQEGIDSLLVQSEGGYGDTFMTMRWLSLLKERKRVGKVGLMIWKPLKDFCDWHALGVDEVYIVNEDKIRFGSWQYAISVLSLPAAFQVRSWGDIPPVSNTNAGTLVRYAGLTAVPYGKIERIGFCWRAEENTSPVRIKSLPVEVAEEVVAHLYDHEVYGYPDIFSLSPTKKDLYNDSIFDQPASIECEPDRMTDWRATAEYLCSMDFVLTVDTAVAHLCGLLGVPTLVLLPRASCWRWGIGIGAVTPWYGPHLTVYRQPRALDWNADEIVAAVIERISK